ncbi:MAG: helix-turn-helix transcriptional regulator [Clostridia bacterium]|nr:helix-turn-helix transcriptional regulator [Clostridia bacterium]
MNRLRDLREDNNLTQEQCAKIAYISKKSYERYENGQNVLPTDVLIKFCKYYNVSADYVLGLINEFRKLY